MWVLLHKNNFHYNYYYILSPAPGKNSISLGRDSDCGFSFPTEKSVSRQHATINLEYNSNSNNNTQFLYLVDSSKFGSFIIRNNKTIKVHNNKILLSDNDEIYCGCTNNNTVIRAVKYDISVCSSYLSTEHKILFSNYTKFFDLTILNEIQPIDSENNINYNILLMSFLAPTQKFTSALIYNIPIVGISFLTDLYKISNILQNGEFTHFQNLQKYLPSKKDSDNFVLPDNIHELISLSRKNLLNDCNIVFLDKVQYLSQHKDQIQYCGGNCILISSPNELKSLDNYIVIQPTPENAQLLLSKQWKRASIQLVDINDLGLAFITNSIETLQFVKKRRPRKMIIEEPVESSIHDSLDTDNSNKKISSSIPSQENDHGIDLESQKISRGRRKLEDINLEDLIIPNSALSQQNETKEIFSKNIDDLHSQPRKVKKEKTKLDSINTFVNNNEIIEDKKFSGSSGSHKTVQNISFLETDSIPPSLFETTPFIQKSDFKDPISSLSYKVVYKDLTSSNDNELESMLDYTNKEILENNQEIIWNEERDNKYNTRRKRR